MPSFDSDGVRIDFLDEGEGEPILLIHGFASNVATNWVGPEWVRTLKGAGRRVIAYDNRGHGKSEKLYDPDVYGAPSMAEDGRRLLDHLGIARADVMGYSMGARIAAFLALRHPARVRSLVLAGLGINMVRGMVGTGPIAHALEAPRSEDVTNETARSFRAFAEFDGERPQGACRLHQRPAREDHASRSCHPRGSHPGCSGHRGRDRGLRRRPCKSDPRRTTP